MATQQKRRTQDEGEENTDELGRKHDSRGRFITGGEDGDEGEDGNEAQEQGSGQGGNQGAGGTGSRGSNSNSGSSRGRSGSGSGSGSADQAGKRVISRAVRVLNEIEARIHELREELEEQQNGQDGGRSQSQTRGGGRARQAEEGEGEEHDGEVEPNAQGRVKHPETDRRLKQNRGD